MRASTGDFFHLAFLIQQRLGLQGSLRYALYERTGSLVKDAPWQRKVRSSQDESTYSLRVRGVPYPLLCRVNTSNRWAFGQVFVRQEYGSLPADLHPKLILDCGANVGYTSVYFLTRYASSRVIAVEPDLHNFQILQRNLAPYGERALAIHAAIWSEATHLKLCSAQEANMGEWAFWVRECQPDETPDVQAVDIQTILSDSGFSQIDILKIDIEGAETQIFSQNYGGWIDKVETFLIELHGPEAESVFRSTLDKRPFHFSQMGEVTIARRVNDESLES